MKFTTLTNLLSVFALSAVPNVSAQAEHVRRVPTKQLDVYSPQIFTPKGGEIWYQGETQNVTWDTSNPPKQITNTLGKVYLRQGSYTYPFILARGFNITQGWVAFKTPQVESISNVQLVLMGNSDNWSQPFSIRDYARPDGPDDKERVDWTAPASCGGRLNRASGARH